MNSRHNPTGIARNITAKPQKTHNLTMDKMNRMNTINDTNTIQAIPSKNQKVINNIVLRIIFPPLIPLKIPALLSKSTETINFMQQTI